MSCSRSYGKSVQSFTNKYDVSCRFVAYALFRGGGSLLLFVEGIYREKSLDFVQCFSMSIEMTM